MLLEGSDGLVGPALSEIRIAQVIPCRLVLWLQLHRALEHLDSGPEVAGLKSADARFIKLRSFNVFGRLRRSLLGVLQRELLRLVGENSPSKGTIITQASHGQIAPQQLHGSLGSEGVS